MSLGHPERRAHRSLRRTHGAVVRLRHHAIRRDPPRPRVELPGLRHPAARLAGRRLRGALRPERHRCGRPAARAGHRDRRRLGRTRSEPGRTLPERHGTPQHPSPRGLRRGHRGHRADRRRRRATHRARCRLHGRHPGQCRRRRRLLRRARRGRRRLAPRRGEWTRRGHDGRVLRRARGRPRPSRETRRLRSAALAGGARRRAELGVSRRPRASRLAHRVLGHRPPASRIGLHGPGRRLRPRLPAPRSECRARRGAVRPPARQGVQPRRHGRLRGHEDVEVPRQPRPRLTLGRRRCRPLGHPARDPREPLPQ